MSETIFKIEGVEVETVKFAQSADQVEVTKGPMWGVDENGETWFEPGDYFRKFIPGVATTTLTVRSVEPLADATPGSVRGRQGVWRKVSQSFDHDIFETVLVFDVGEDV